MAMVYRSRQTKVMRRTERMQYIKWTGCPCTIQRRTRSQTAYANSLALVRGPCDKRLRPGSSSSRRRAPSATPFAHTASTCCLRTVASGVLTLGVGSNDVRLGEKAGVGGYRVRSSCRRRIGKEMEVLLPNLCDEGAGLRRGCRVESRAAVGSRMRGRWEMLRRT
ncbi:hypothetical protein B0H14DRAFT_2589649 [Mycena olivaceomarginata]|nr:hypothetical protein B0H14DRAFT_2589649 [Mycena olivaceomarginata]